MPIHVLLIEDDDDLRESLATYLTGAGFAVRAAANAEDLAAEMTRHPADIVVLDINLPGADGFDAAIEVRQRAGTGIVMLTGRSRQADRLHGLSLGADHYMVKPADPAELEMVIRNLYGRIKGLSLPAPDAEAWILDTKRWILASPGGVGVPLSAAERHLLERLLQQPGVPVPRIELIAPGSRQDADSTGRALDVLVFRLRRKVELACDRPLPLLSARGIGYVFAGTALIRHE
ncbi:response regulator transcription factor [Aquabacter spiritensis]|uniref:Winged helix family two component transcriptional regulator n=1 Tax=Aquabacter spiritensis TaxID=933073 RepID=A0A4R3M2V4_9HYPH|nr:response regulator transcription factor [Aquabacter spiritensis]TCT05587.1 winged helix family two component transcriptional regulator [Aquabacter spiritensis]